MKAQDKGAQYSGLLPGHGRFDYAPITGRTNYRWPNGAGLAIYIGFNIEHFAFGECLGANIGAPSPQPDVLNYSWREYGNRIGAWRCLAELDRLRLPSAALINTALYDHCPQLVAACVARDDEIVGHGHNNAERPAIGRDDHTIWMTAPGAICDHAAQHVNQETRS
jgi:hypothetical protein